jgi:hypothetical protein
MSPIRTLAWGIWIRNRHAAWTAIGLTVFACMGNLLLPASARFAEGGGPRILIGMLNFNMGTAVFLLVLAVFGYTEFDPQRNTAGFPTRLFVLPVTSLKLVAVPTVLGVAAIELVALLWGELVFGHGDLSMWFLFAAPMYMVFYQTILWTLPGVRSLRLMLLGLPGAVLFMLPIAQLPGHSMRPFMVSIAALAVVSFLTSWGVVARQRSGGESTAWIPALIRELSDRLPRRTRPFASAAHAQFWFEWRRFGLVLPIFIAGLLCVLFFPISWDHRNEAGSTFRILVSVLAMPMVLAWPVGKGFSKPDFWSQELSVPGFIAVRPITSTDLVLIKMKVAALSSAISWLIVFLFVSLWLPLWADPQALVHARALIQNVYGPSLFPQVAIAALALLAAVLLTWRLLVGSLWIGLSGNKTAFIASALPYALFPVIVIVGIVFLVNIPQSYDWAHLDLDPLPAFEIIATLAVAAKIVIWVFSWTDVEPRRVNQYLFFWIGSTICMLALAVFLWEVARPHLPPDAYGIRNLLLLAALLIVPLARIGRAPAALVKNRHR